MIEKAIVTRKTKIFENTVVTIISGKTTIFKKTVVIEKTIPIGKTSAIEKSTITSRL